MSRVVPIATLVGKTFDSVVLSKDKTELTFKGPWGEYSLFHDRDCCEWVELEEMDGDLDYLVGTPILSAAESTNQDGDCPDMSCTWTFYLITTLKGSVHLRWLGTSNGYYSEEVELHEMEVVL